MRFLPKDEGFFGLFDQLSATLRTSATLLRTLFDQPHRLEELAAQIKAEEHTADAITYDVMQRIDRSFVTPLDREDIHLLANRLDNVVDLMDGTARRAQMFQITERREAALGLIDVLVNCTTAIGEGVKDIRKPAAVHKAAREVKKLEEQADALYAKAIKSLFSGTPDALEVIKWKEIYDNLEHAVDECEDVANVLESISLKNSLIVVWYILAIVGVAFIFDYINGFHDSANSIATIVGTRVLSPFTAVVWAATFNFIALFIFETKVAKTIGTGMIDMAIVNPDVILAGLLGAITWNLITWWYGIPSSSSHALIGGYGGAAIAKAGFAALLLPGWVKPVIFIFLSPMVGMAAGWALMIGTTWLFRKARPASVEPLFRGMQITSSALFSHGANDAQKTMGIIVSLLVAGQAYFVNETGFLRHFYLASGETIPFWIKFGAHFAIAMGTLMGGWRIVHTLGSQVTKLRPMGGFCAETGGASAIFLATAMGIPVSTTHTISGAIVKSAPRTGSAVRWGVASRMVWAWILTIPASAIVAAISYFVVAAIRG